MITRMRFLGTGGGRFSTIFQSRATGGIYIESGIRLHVDPGPCSLNQLKNFHINPTKTDVLLISHCHPDHYTDGEIMVEGMTHGGRKRRGLLVGSKSVLEGVDDVGPAISPYHRSLINHKTLEAGDFLNLGDVDLEATRSVHSDPTTIGFKFHTQNGVISYVADTELSDEVVEAHRGARVLILPVTRPRSSRIDWHLSTEDAVDFIKRVEPEITFFTHFGLKMLRVPPEIEAYWVQEETGYRVIAAKDGMKVSIGTRITVK